jgi:hypothetical protein
MSICLCCRSCPREPFWTFGVVTHRTRNQAVEIDQDNGNHLWQESEATEMKQLAEYKTFIDKGKGGILPDGYKKITFHMVYDVKHNGSHKSRLVAGGHCTDPDVIRILLACFVAFCPSKLWYSNLYLSNLLCAAEVAKLDLWGAIYQLTKYL